eukprot:6209819-Pleurochrysis_carterae.AAC.5
MHSHAHACSFLCMRVLPCLLSRAHVAGDVIIPCKCVKERFLSSSAPVSRQVNLDGDLAEMAFDWSGVQYNTAATVSVGARPL